MSVQCRLQIIILDLLCDKFDVREGTFLLGRSRTGLLSALLLGVSASGTPLASVLVGRLSRSFGCLSRCACLRRSGGGSGPRLRGRGGGLRWERDNRLDRRGGSGGSSDATGPGHRLGRPLGLLGLRSRGTGGSWCRAGLLGNFRLLGLLFSDLLRSGFWLRGGLHSRLRLGGSLLSGWCRLGGGLDGGGGGRVLGGGAGLLELLVDSLGVKCGRAALSRLFDVHLLWLGLCGELLGGLNLRSWSSLLDSGLGLLTLINVSQDIIQQVVSSRLAGEDESLDEFLGLFVLVGNLADDLDDNVIVRGLGVDIGDADLALLEIKLLNALGDGLRRRRC